MDEQTRRDQNKREGAHPDPDAAQEQGWSPPAFDPQSMWELIQSRKLSGLTGENVMSFHKGDSPQEEAGKGLAVEPAQAAAKPTQEAQQEQPAQQPAGGEGGGDKQSGIDETALKAVIDAVVAVVPQDITSYAQTAIPHLLRQSAQSGIKNPRQVAYILATVEHEIQFGAPNLNGDTLVEGHNHFRSKTHTKGKRKGQTTWSATNHLTDRRITADSEEELETKYWDDAYGHKLENRKGTTDARDFRGRGYVQLTGRELYGRMSKVLNERGFSYQLDGKTWGQGGEPIDLLTYPDHANRSLELAARIAVEAPRDGLFTFKKLDDYINDGPTDSPKDDETDYRNARRVINGDTAKNGDKIAAIAERFQKPLEAGDAWKKIVANATDPQQAAGAPASAPLPAGQE